MKPNTSHMVAALAAAATPLLFLRLLLRLDPWLPQGRISLAPALPSWLTRLSIEGIPLGDLKVDVTVEDVTTTVSGLGDGLLLEGTPRQALTRLISDLA